MPDVAWPHAHRVRVIWRDLDAAGHVNNSVYFTYMETARTEVFLRLRDGRTWRDLDIILASTSCDFRAAATLGDELEVLVRPGRVGKTSFDLRYEIRDAATRRLVAEGESTQVMYDYAAGAKKDVPPDVRARLERGA